MGLVVGSTVILWLLVAVVAFGARPAQTGAGAKEKSRDKEQQR